MLQCAIGTSRRCYIPFQGLAFHKSRLRKECTFLHHANHRTNVTLKEGRAFEKPTALAVKFTCIMCYFQVLRTLDRRESRHHDFFATFCLEAAFSLDVFSYSFSPFSPMLASRRVRQSLPFSRSWLDPFYNITISLCRQLVLIV